MTTYVIHFSPIEDYASYQLITEEQASALSLAWGPPELIEFFPRLYYVDDKEWICIADSLEEAQMEMFARWVLCLAGLFKDSIEWFDMDNDFDLKKVLQTDIPYWVNKAKIQLFFDIYSNNIFDELTE